VTARSLNEEFEVLGLRDEFAEQCREALDNLDAQFFRKLAEQCEIESLDFFKVNATKLARLLAHQVKKDLLERGKPINRRTIKRQVELEMAARWDRKTLPMTEEATILGWGKRHFRELLRSYLAENKDYKNRLDDLVMRLPEISWKRIFKEPGLKDVPIR
jgi:hypothetical protein